MIGLVRTLGIQVIVSENILHGLLTFILCRGTLRIFDLGDYFPESIQAYYKSRLTTWLVRTVVTILTRLNIRFADVCISPHPLMLEMVRKEFDPDKSVYWVPNGVDTRLFRFEPPNQGLVRELNVTENTACFVGLVEPWTDFETLVNAVELIVRKIPDYNVIMVAPEQGEPQARLRQLAARKGIEDHFRWIGLVDRKAVPKYINLAKMGLCPFGEKKRVITTQLAIPQKLAEYSACGKPTLIPPILSLNPKEAPHVFIYRGPEELASLQERFLLDKGFQDQVRAQAIDFAKSYDYGRVARQFHVMTRFEMRKRGYGAFSRFPCVNEDDRSVIVSTGEVDRSKIR